MIPKYGFMFLLLSLDSVLIELNGNNTLLLIHTFKPSGAPQHAGPAPFVQ